MSSAQKKVILRRFPGEIHHGYLPSAGFLHGGEIALLDLQGRLASVPIAEVKTICYVRDFNLGDPVHPERLGRTSFLARPRGEGLWVRLTFRDDASTLEGLAPSDAGLLDSVENDSGIQLTPPDTRSNTQRIYVPRLAISALEMLAVITSPTRRRERLAAATSPARRDPLQVDLFPEAELPTPSQLRGNRVIR